MSIAVYFIAYLIGSIPIGYIMAKLKGVDIRQSGSGNIGATNVIRVLGTGPGLFVFFLDTMKGVVACLLAYQFIELRELVFACGFCCVLGHSTSPFLKFKGGKGVSTALGVLIASVPMVAFISLSVFLLVVMLTRYVSLGSIFAATTVGATGWLVQDNIIVSIVCTLLGSMVILLHTKNIKRLVTGTESKLSFKKQEKQLVN